MVRNMVFSSDKFPDGAHMYLILIYKQVTLLARN